MTAFKHTFSYATQADLIFQLQSTAAKLLRSVPMEPYCDVRKRYQHLSPSAFTMRLRRFELAGGTFPNRKGRKGEKIQEMFVTFPLSEWLGKKFVRKGRELSCNSEQKKIG